MNNSGELDPRDILCKLFDIAPKELAISAALRSGERDILSLELMIVPSTREALYRKDFEILMQWAWWYALGGEKAPFLLKQDVHVVRCDLSLLQGYAGVCGAELNIYGAITHVYVAAFDERTQPI